MIKMSKKCKRYTFDYCVSSEIFCILTKAQIGGYGVVRG